MHDIPEKPLLFSPKQSNEFKNLGEELVSQMIFLGPICSIIFNQMMMPGQQQILLNMVYKHMKGIHDSLQTGYGAKGHKGYYFTNRRFSLIIPEAYKRSPNCPRVTSITPNSVHGMKKDFQVAIWKVFSVLFPGFMIFEIDLSACHSRIASSLLKQADNPLEMSLKQPNFWESEIEVYFPMFKEANPSIDFKTVKGLFKAFLYTSLNGGNPGSPERVRAVLDTKAKAFCTEEFFDAMFKATTHAATTWPLVVAVKKLNQNSFAVSLSDPSQVNVHCLDRIESYKLPRDMSYCGISRVLQSFEIILLALLTAYSINLDMLMLSLEQDGLTAMIKIDLTEPKDLQEVKSEVEQVLTDLMSPWSTYLLGQPMPIVVKRVFLSGNMVE